MPTVLSVVHNLIIGKTGGAIILCSNEICFYGDSTVTLSSAFIIFACLIFFLCVQNGTKGLLHAI